MYIWGVQKNKNARQDSPGGPGVKNLPARAGDTGLISGPEVPTMLGGN